MKLIITLTLFLGLIACEIADEHESESSESDVEVAGRLCAEQGNTIEQCSLVCSKMGSMKSTCWEAYFKENEKRKNERK